MIKKKNVFIALENMILWQRSGRPIQIYKYIYIYNKKEKTLLQNSTNEHNSVIGITLILI